jgi:hypothetical protein
VHLVGFVIRMHHDARSSECQNLDVFARNNIYGDYDWRFENIPTVTKEIKILPTL